MTKPKNTRFSTIQIDVAPDSWPGNTIEVDVEFEVIDHSWDEINVDIIHLSTETEDGEADLDWMMEHMRLRASIQEIIEDELLGELYDRADRAA